MYESLSSDNNLQVAEFAYGKHSTSYEELQQYHLIF